MARRKISETAPKAEQGSVATLEPGADAQAVLNAALVLNEEDKRDLVAALVEYMSPPEELNEEDRADIRDEMQSWRAADPNVWVVGLIARVVGGTLRANDIRLECTRYMAGRTPTMQNQLRGRITRALATAAQAADIATQHL